MEFEEVINFRRSTDEANSVLEQQQQQDNNPYHSLLVQQSRKPKLSNFVHRLKQQSSKTRFVREYKKLTSVSDTEDEEYSVPDDASIRIIDPTRPIVQEDDIQDEEGEVEQLLVQRRIEKQPIRKRVHINEEANQINHNNDDLASSIITINQYLTLENALEYINKDISEKNDEIMKQIRRIEINRDEITRYKQDLLNMQSQLDFFHHSLRGLQSDHLADMVTHEQNALKNTEKMKEHKKKNLLLKSRFDKYRKAISLDTRLLELDNKIKAAWRRDEIWSGIRDWGFLSILLLSFILASLMAWRQ